MNYMVLFYLEFYTDRFEILSLIFQNLRQKRQPSWNINQSEAALYPLEWGFTQNGLKLNRKTGEDQKMVWN